VVVGIFEQGKLFCFEEFLSEYVCEYIQSDHGVYITLLAKGLDKKKEGNQF
jgi:hypothetical protein